MANLSSYKVTAGTKITAEKFNNLITAIEEALPLTAKLVETQRVQIPTPPSTGSTTTITTTQTITQDWDYCEMYLDLQGIYEYSNGYLGRSLLSASSRSFKISKPNNNGTYTYYYEIPGNNNTTGSHSQGISTCAVEIKSTTVTLSRARNGEVSSFAGGSVWFWFYKYV